MIFGAYFFEIKSYLKKMKYKNFLHENRNW